MPTSVKIAFLTDLIALWLEKACHNWVPFLPLTGDHFGQLAILLVFAIIIDEITSFFR